MRNIRISDVSKNGGRAPLIVSEAGFHRPVPRPRKPVAKDICDVLDVRTNNVRAIPDADEVGGFSNDYSIDIAQNGGRAPLIVSESGFYKLVLRSRKPVAKSK